MTWLYKKPNINTCAKVSRKSKAIAFILMKTHKNLFNKAFNFENMIASYKKARKGHSKSL